MDVMKAQSFHCPVEASMGIIGGKYKAIIIYELIHRTLRYSEIQWLVPQATPRMLSRQLRELEEDGIVNRVLYPVVPPKTEYSLTELGETLIPVIQALCTWGEGFFQHMGIPNPCDERTINPML